MRVEQRIAGRADYVQLLRSMLRLHRSIEGAIDRGPSDAAAWPAQWRLSARRKSSLIVADLEALGDSRRAIAALRPVAAVHQWQHTVGMLGGLWVTEGSTLGGQHLSRLFRSRLQIGPHTGGAFFHGYGARTGSMWRQWLQAIESGLPDGPRRQAAGEAAVATFKLFFRTLVDDSADRAGAATPPCPPKY